MRTIVGSFGIRSSAENSFTPCGTIWVRLYVDNDESGELSPGDLVCQRAAPNGIVLMRLSHEAPTVECTLTQARAGR